MYKVLIVDDEFIVRKGLISCIHWEQMNLSLLGEAANGKEALEIIGKEIPDIILLDLIMPEMNGLELIQKLAELNIKSNIIILSCHEDYNYVREAFKQGVRDYILKLSATPDEISNILIDVVSQITAEKEPAKQQRPGIPIYEISEYSHPNGDFPESSHYVLASFHHSAVPLSDLQLQVSNWIIKKTISVGNIHLGLLNGSILLLIYTFFPVQLTDNDAIGLFYDALKDLHTQLPLKIGVSHTADLKKPFYKAFRESQKALDELFYHTNDSIGVYSHLEDMFFTRTDSERTLFQQKVSELIQRQGYTSLYHLVTQYYSTTLKDAMLDPNLIKLDSIEFIHLLHNNLRKHKIDLSEVDEAYSYYYQVIADIHSLDELAAYMIEITRNICAYLEQNSPKNIRSDIRNAIAFIEKYYYKEISLADVAEHINISKNHLSYLFKKEMDENFSDYLIRVRIQKSKELLTSSPDLNISEIAERTGFNDSGYFSKVFKKATGTSPYNYKQGR